MQKRKIRLKGRQIEKAKEIEREAMKGMEFFPEDKGDEQRRFRNMMEELREKGLLTEEEEREIFGEGGHLEREKMPFRVEGEYRESPDLHKKTFPQKFGRAAAMVVMVLAGICAAAMTSEANRSTVVRTVRGWIGDSAQVDVINDAGNADRNIPEDEARMKIAEQLDVRVPYLGYKPSGMEYVEYELYPEAGCGIMHYTLNGNYLVLQIVADKNGKKGASTLKGESVTKLELPEGIGTAEIYREKNPDRSSPTLNAQWKFDDTYYQLGGNLDEKELINILKKIWY